MSERERLLREAIRRLDTAYHQLWGMVCAKDIGTTGGEKGRAVFEGYYREFHRIMKKANGKLAKGESGQ